MRVVSSAYLRLLTFLPAILIPPCASSILAFHMMYSAYKLNKQGDKIQPSCTLFPIWNQSVVSCPALTVASWPVCRLLRRHMSLLPIIKCLDSQIHAGFFSWNATCCQCTCHLALFTSPCGNWGLGNTQEKVGTQLLLLLWVIESFASDPRVSHLLPAFVELWQDK